MGKFLSGWVHHRDPNCVAVLIYMHLRGGRGRGRDRAAVRRERLGEAGIEFLVLTACRSGEVRGAAGQAVLPYLHSGFQMILPLSASG